MWRLMKRFQVWASTRTGVRDERGAVLVFVAVGLVMLLGFTAFTVDFGRIYSERRELQNGADAAALAVAQDCAFGDCGSSGEQYNTAEEYVDANASDHLAWVENINLDLGAQQVTVYNATEDPGGDHFFDMTFAKVIGYDGLTVRADATVAWGAPKGGTTLPIIFSLCEWEKFSGITHPGSAVLDGELPPTGGYPRASEFVTIFFHGDSESCHESPSGQDLPGGFGWLENASNCAADIDAFGWVGVDTGASPTTGCSRSFMTSLIGEVVLIPYFDDVRGTGNNIEYHVAGFGAIYITGYHFTGQYREESIITSHRPCDPPDMCIQGYLIDPWKADGGGEIGGGDFGVVVIQFVD